VRAASCWRGNHDDAVFGDARRFNPVAREAITFTRARLRPGLLASRKTVERWEWLASLKGAAPYGDFLFVHGSPRDPVNEYVYREDVFFNADTKLKEIFDGLQRVTFCGHTHVPCVIGSDMTTFTPKDGDAAFTFAPGMKYIVNVGSVGQPRDRDPRSAWTEVDGDTVKFHRVPYDIAAVQRKIRAIPELFEVLARRLEDGM
jgi:diadenosine tetraphosphatase ApaH/serine/threonine PP2A family protein phosphatase